MTVPLQSPATSALVQPLVNWFDVAARDLPWRHPGIGAWPVLVSEVMLQQTPVSRVLPRYHAWLERWPTPAHLAGDSPGEAVRMWGKLGYPRRALRLHACAVRLRDEFDSMVPDSLQDLLRLPGIGDYTARAVLAFGYGQRAAVVDTNVRRVINRAVDGNATSGPISTVRDLAAMQRLLPDDDRTAVRFCAAIMELGAVCCTARSPRCPECPIRSRCAWRLAGSPAAEGTVRGQPKFAGSDRQVRGLLLDVLRASDEPVRARVLDLVWPDQQQRERALAGLVADGLVETRQDGSLSLPS